MCARFFNLAPALAGKSGSMAVFALFSRSQKPARSMQLAMDCLGKGTVRVAELPSANVPALEVDNELDQPVLFLVGDLVKGGRQDRVVSASVVVPAKSRSSISVRCVEPRRWHTFEDDNTFRASETCCPSSVRSVLHTAAGDTRHADQHTVWSRVSNTLADFDVTHAEGSVTAVHDAKRDDVNRILSSFEVMGDPVGIAIAIGDKVVAVDVFATPTLCSAAWRRLARAYALDSLKSAATECSVSRADVRTVLELAANAQWTSNASSGEQCSTSMFGDWKASTLTAGPDDLIHASVVRIH